MGDGVAVAWYRTIPKIESCGDGGAVWGQYGTQSAKEGLEDGISIAVVMGRKKGALVVSVGGREGI